MEVVNILEFAKRLPTKHRRLRGLISDTHDLHTVHTDLTLAFDFVSRAIELQTKAGSIPGQAIEDCTLALLSSAIVSYARATKARSRHRKTFDFRAAFDADELEAHCLICDLRDDAIAHYGPGRLSDAARLREDHMLLPVDEQRLVFTSRSVWGSGRLSHLIRRQVHRALLISQRWFEEKQDEMITELNRVVHDPEIIGARDAALMYINDALGDAQIAADILRGPRVGRKRLSGSFPARS